jgi:hypothetical protein
MMWAKLASASAQFDQLQALDANFLPTWLGSFFPANFAYVPVLIFVVSVLVLVWSKQTLIIPFILLVIFLGSFNFVLPESGFILGSWVFYGIAIFAGTIILVKLFWRD